MIKRKGLPRGMRQYLRLQKAAIRRTVFDFGEQQRKIEALYQQLNIKKPE